MRTKYGKSSAVTAFSSLAGASAITSRQTRPSIDYFARFGESLKLEPSLENQGSLISIGFRFVPAPTFLAVALK